MANMKKSPLRERKNRRRGVLGSSRLSFYVGTLARALETDPEPRALVWSADGRQFLVRNQERFVRRYLNSEDWFRLSSWSSFLRIMTGLNFKRQELADEGGVCFTHHHWTRPMMLRALEAQGYIVMNGASNGRRDHEATCWPRKPARRSNGAAHRSDRSTSSDGSFGQNIENVLENATQTSQSVTTIDVDEKLQQLGDGERSMFFRRYANYSTDGLLSEQNRRRHNFATDPAQYALEDLLNESEHSSIKTSEVTARAVMMVQEGGRTKISNGDPRGNVPHHEALAALIRESVEEALREWSSKVELYVSDELRILSEKLSQLLISIEKVESGQCRMMHQLESMRLLGVDVQMSLRQVFGRTGRTPPSRTDAP